MCGLAQLGHHHHSEQSVGRTVCGPGKWQWNHQVFEEWGQIGCKRGNKVSLSSEAAVSNEHGKWGR